MKNQTRQFNSLSRFAAVALTLCVACAASAEDILGNYPVTNDDIGLTLLGQQRRAAMSFTMPTESPYSVNSVTLRLNIFVNGGPSTPILQIRDHDAETDSPGSGVIASIVGSTVTSAAAADYVFIPGGEVTLLPSQKYWLNVYSEGTTSLFPVNWRGSVPSLTPTGIATFGSGMFSHDHGATWVPTTTIPSFVIDGIAVPEPASLAMVGLGATAILRRRPTRGVAL